MPKIQPMEWTQKGPFFSEPRASYGDCWAVINRKLVIRSHPLGCSSPGMNLSKEFGVCLCWDLSAWGSRFISIPTLFTLGRATLLCLDNFTFRCFHSQDVGSQRRRLGRVLFHTWVTSLILLLVSNTEEHIFSPPSPSPAYCLPQVFFDLSLIIYCLITFTSSLPANALRWLASRQQSNSAPNPQIFPL